MIFVPGSGGEKKSGNPKRRLDSSVFSAKIAGRCVQVCGTRRCASLRSIAQPGLERLVRDQEVGGSNPLAPICADPRVPPEVAWIVGSVRSWDRGGRRGVGSWMCEERRAVKR